MITDPGSSTLSSMARLNVGTGLVRFGNYNLILLLGHGGMADVFLSVYSGQVAEGFNKLIVIKRLRENLAENPEFVQMLLDEARLAARLNHPNVVQTNEIGLVGTQYFIAMEYLDGQPLHRIIWRAARAAAKAPPSATVSGGIPHNVALTMVCDVLAGLHYAHEMADYDGTPLNIVHRDVSPQNIFVTYTGQVKLVDFGIAKAAGRSSETREGVVKGKIAYMAPEQPVGQTLDRRADIFAVGIVLWELMTARRMWKGIDDISIFHRLIARDIPNSPREVNPSVPEEIDRICRRALSTEPADRYATAAEFQMDLERFLRSNNAYASARELGEFVTGLFADKRAEAKQIIDTRLAELRNAPSLPELRPGELPPTVEAVQAETNAPSSPTTVAPYAPPAKRSAAAGVVLLLVGAAVVGGGVFAATKTSLLASMRPQPAPPVETAEPPRAPVEEAPLAHVNLRATPAEARLYLDGALLQSNPVTKSFARDGTTHIVRAEAPGYVAAKRAITFDVESLNIDIPLAPNPPPPAKSRVVSGPVRQASSRNTAAESHPHAESPPENAQEPAVTTATTATKTTPKMPTLDTDNPYGLGKKSPPK